MHQFAEATDEQPSTLTVEISFWSQDIFRVQFSRDSIRATPPQFPPPQARMLIGRAQTNFSLSMIDTLGEWVISTEAIALHIDKASLRFWAMNVHEEVFFQQRRTDLFTSDVYDMAFSEHHGEELGPRESGRDVRTG